MLPKKIVAIGASSTFGRVDPKHGGFIGRLKTWHEAQNELEHRVYNLGISGQTSGEVLSRLTPEASIRKPGLIIISVGLNDTRRNDQKENPIQTSVTEFQQNIIQIIEQAKKLCPVIFVSINPIDETRTQPFTIHGRDYYYAFEDANIYANATRDICADKKIPYLDISKKLLEGGYHHLLAEDGLHCNEQGHTQIFEELRAFLIETYQDK